MAKDKVCNNCHGNKKITVWNKKKQTYEEVICPACKGKGTVNPGLI